jgi:hypothetical protein
MYWNSPDTVITLWNVFSRKITVNDEQGMVHGEYLIGEDGQPTRVDEIYIALGDIVQFSRKGFDVYIYQLSAQGYVIYSFATERLAQEAIEDILSQIAKSTQCFCEECLVHNKPLNVKSISQDMTQNGEANE